MHIEMYIGLLDHTWYLQTIEIPDDTPKDEIELTAYNKLDEILQKYNTKFAFSGVYYIFPPEEDNQEEEEEGMTLTEEQKQAYLDSLGQVCPFCNKTQLEGGPIEIDENIALQEITCLTCRKYWTDIYKLAATKEGEEEKG